MSFISSLVYKYCCCCLKSASPKAEGFKALPTDLSIEDLEAELCSIAHNQTENDNDNDFTIDDFTIEDLEESFQDGDLPERMKQILSVIGESDPFDTSFSSISSSSSVSTSSSLVSTSSASSTSPPQSKQDEIHQALEEILCSDDFNSSSSSTSTSTTTAPSKSDNHTQDHSKSNNYIHGTHDKHNNKQPNKMNDKHHNTHNTNHHNTNHHHRPHHHHTNPFFRLHIPRSGEWTAEHITNFIDFIHNATQKQQNLTYPDLFAWLASGRTRVLKGSTLKPFLARGLQNTSLKPEYHSFMKLLHDYLVEIKATNDTLELHLKYPKNAATHLFDIPSSKAWVLASKHTDPFLVHKNNKAEFAASEKRSFELKNTILVTYDKNGITGVRSGDISFKKFISLAANMRSETKHNTKEYDGQHRAFIDFDASNQPLVVDNHYLPKEYDYWVIVTVLKTDVWVALPPLS